MRNSANTVRRWLLRPPWLLLCACLATLLQAGALAAPNYPIRPVTLVVPYPPGGAADVLARLLGEKLSSRWGQPVVVENRVGASGQIGSEYVGQAKGDPYRLLVGSQAVFSVLPLIDGRSDFNLSENYTPISLLVQTPGVLLVPAGLHVKTPEELADMLKSAPPGTYSYSSIGVGTSQHLIAAQILDKLGVRALHVPYRGSGQALAALAAGDQVALSVDNVPSAHTATQSGRVRAIAVTTKERLPMMPDVKTLDETILPGFEMTTWMGLIAPPGIARDTQEFLSQEVRTVMNDPALRARLSELGFLPLTSSPEEFRRLASRETAQLKVLIDSLRIRRE